MANLIVDLPRCLSMSILCGYVEESAVGRLDSAFCGAKQREQFLEIMRSDEFTLKGNTVFRPNQGLPYIKYLQWCATRSVRISSFHWVSELQPLGEQALTSILRLSAPHFESLVVIGRDCDAPVQQWLQFNRLKDLSWYTFSCGSDSSEKLVAVLKRAPLLEMCHVYGLLGSTHFTADSTVVCENAKELRVTGSLGRDNADWWVRAFPNVTEFELLLGPFDPYEQMHTVDLPRFPCLQKLVTNVFLGEPDVMLIADGCPQLKHIHLHTDITDVCMEYLCSRCPQLETVCFAENDHLTSECLLSLSRHLSASLQHLDLRSCFDITSFKNLQKCTLLEYLNVSSGTLNDSDLHLLFPHCPRLREVHVDYRDIDDRALYALALYCPHLQVLSISGCSNYTDQALCALVDNARELSKLTITDIGTSKSLQESLKRRNCLLEVNEPSRISYSGSSSSGSESGSDEGSNSGDTV